MSHTAHPRNVDYTNSSCIEKGYLPSCRMAPDNFEKRSAVYTVVHQQSVISSTTNVMFHSGINKILNAEHFVVEFDSHSSNIICVLPVIYHTFLGIKTTNKSHCKHLDKGGKKSTQSKVAKSKHQTNLIVFWKNNWTREKGQQQMQHIKFYEILSLMEESTHHICEWHEDCKDFLQNTAQNWK